MQTSMLIGGALAAGENSPEAVLNPRTGETIAEVPEASEAQVDAAVAAARGAFDDLVADHARSSASTALHRIADRIEAEADAFAALESLNCGKPINAMKGDEIPAIVDCWRFFAAAVRCQHGPIAGEYLAGHTSMIRRDPVGTVASIAPWNYPLMMMAWKLAPALAGGNTVVFKPSEMTPLTALKLAEILADELPAGVANIVTGRGPSVGSALVNHPGIDMISLTGDIGTGKRMLEAAATSVKRTHLELGGKAPVVVFDDADLDAVVEGLKAFGYYNSGQDCTAASRIYAADGIYERLVADLSSAVDGIVYDAPDDATNDIGPLISARQRDRVAGFVDRARDLAHVEVTAGGRAGRRQRLLLRPDRGRRRPAGRRDRPPRGLRPGRLGHPLRRASTRPSPGPTTATTASPRRSGRKTSARRWPAPRASATAPPGSTPTSCWSARCRTAA